MQEPCCALGAISERERDRIWYETDHFFVASTLGPMGIERYVLVISKEHYQGVGDIDTDELKELGEVVDHTRRIIGEQYGRPPLVFENGPRVCGIRGGGCLDHAHLHVLPTVSIREEFAVDMLNRLQGKNQYYRVDRVGGFERLGDILRRGESSHLFVQFPEGERIVSEVSFPIPSQYLRRMIASKLGRDNWNWRMYPDEETMRRTAERLAGKF